MRRFSKPRERWPRTKKLLTYFVLILLVLGMAGRPLVRGAFYQSYWGGAVFVPVFFVFVTLIVVIAVIDLRKK